MQVHGVAFFLMCEPNQPGTAHDMTALFVEGLPTRSIRANDL
jgi:hypothetical protein